MRGEPLSGMIQKPLQIMTKPPVCGLGCRSSQSSMIWESRDENITVPMQSCVVIDGYLNWAGGKYGQAAADESERLVPRRSLHRSGSCRMLLETFGYHGWE